MKYLFLIFFPCVVLSAPYPGGSGPYPVQYDPGQQSLLSPPHVGPGRMDSVAHSLHNQGGLNSSYMRIGGANSNGIVRTLYCVPDINNSSGLFQNPCQVGLRIYPDCGAITNVTSLTPAFDVPLGNLTMNKFRFSTNNNTPYSVVFSSAFLDVITMSTNSVYLTNITTIRLKLPIYFTNAVVFQLYDYTNSRAWSNGYFAASYEFAPSAMNFPYSNYRLRSAQYVGSPVTGSATTLIDLSAKTTGLLVGFTEGTLNFTNADSGGFFDTSTPYFETAGSSVLWEPTGGDDLTLATYSLGSTGGSITPPVAGVGQSINWDWGIVDFYLNPTDYTGKYAIENYRWFLTDNFIWTAGLKLKFQPPTRIDQFNFTILYYAP